MMLMAVRPDVMGRFVISFRLKVLGWVYTEVMAIAVIAMFCSLAAVIRIGAKSIQGTFSELFYDLITLLIKENIMKKSLAVQVNRLNALMSTS